MAQLSKDEVLSTLSNYIEKSFSSDNDESNDVSDKAIKNLSAKLDGIVSFIKDNIKVEKPKSMEEIVAEQLKPILDEIKVIKEKGAATTVKTKKDEDTATIGDIKTIVKDIVTESLNSIVKKTNNKGKGIDDGIDALIRTIAKEEGIAEKDLNDEENSTEENSDEENSDEENSIVGKNKNKNHAIKIETVETHDSATGRELTAKERSNRQELDNYIGEVMQEAHSKLADKDE